MACPLAEIKVQLVALFLTSMIVSGCSKIEPEDTELKGWDGSVPREIVQMPRYEDIPRYKGAAYAGSGAAAIALANFYMKADKSGSLERYWTTIAAENGDPVGQYNLALLMLDKSGPAYSPHRARYWLELSAKQGNTRAAELMASLRK